MTGKPIQEAGKARGAKGIKIAIAAVAAVAVVGIVAVQAAPRILLGKNYKVIQAVGNTFESNHLMDNMNSLDILSSGKYTVNVDASVENVGVEAAFATNTSAQKASMEGKVSYRGEDIDMAAMIDDKQMLVSLPTLTDRTLKYSYIEEKDGYLIDMLEDEGIDVEPIDKTFESFFSKSSKKTGEEVFRKASIKAVKALDFDKSDKRQISIDGKKRNCQGYTSEIDEDLICELCDIYEDAFDEYLEEVGGADDLMKEMDADPSEIFDEIRDQAEYLEGDLTIYIYKKRVAAAACEIDENEVVLELHGGNTPWENTTLEVEGREIMALSGSVKDKVETVNLEVFDAEVFSYEYNYKNGELELAIGEDDEIELEGSVLKSRKNCIYKISDLRVDGSPVDMNGQITIQKGANLAKISEDDIFDIGNASESDWEDLVESLDNPFSNFWF